MKSKLLEHLLSIAFVTLVLVIVLFLVSHGQQAVKHKAKAGIEQFGDLSFVDFTDPFHKALLSDAINIYYPGHYSRNDSLFKAILRFKEKEFTDKLQKAHLEQKLSLGKFIELFGMYIKFLIVYVIVMLLTYYGVQTIAVWRFASKKRNVPFSTMSGSRKARYIIGSIGKGLGVFLLFCPAYVIAYSIRTEFNTDTVVFMALLGVVSNGVLITYANKFYAFLVAESRKGYVDTAIVKNLNNDYAKEGSRGISAGAILRPFKRFENHVFGHIFNNARSQYHATIKEQASFLITGLIIIEMALNIHGHLSYELLRQLLYKNYDIVIVIIAGIFYTVKFTEIFVDYMVHRESLLYENKLMDGSASHE